MRRKHVEALAVPISNTARPGWIIPVHIPHLDVPHLDVPGR